VLSYIVDQKRPDSTPVKSVRDRSEPFLSSGVPHLGLELFALDFDCARRELNADRGRRLEIELVLGESGEKIGLAHAGVTDKNNF